MHATGKHSYSPVLERWVNRDLIEEDGGVNLTEVVRNDALSLFDRLAFPLLSVTPGFRAINQRLQIFAKSAKILLRAWLSPSRFRNGRVFQIAGLIFCRQHLFRLRYRVVESIQDRGAAKQFNNPALL